MAHTRATRVVAVLLLVGGAFNWTLLTGSIPGMDAASVIMFEHPSYDYQTDPGDGQLQVMLFDARMAALLVMAAGAAALAAPWVRTKGDVGYVVLVSLGGMLSAGALLTWFGGWSMAAAAVCGGVLVIGTLVVIARSRSRPASVAVDTAPDETAARGVLATMALLVAAAAPAVGTAGPQPDRWLSELLPEAYRVGVALTEALLCLTALSLAGLTLRRPRVAAVIAGALVAGAGGWLVAAPPVPWDRPWLMLLISGAMVGGTAMLVVSGVRNADGSGPGAWRLFGTLFGAAAGCAALVIPAFALGLPLGMILLSMSGGELGADGLPILLGAPMAGLAGVASYWLAALASEDRSLRRMYTERVTSERHTNTSWGPY
ncbi:MAG TPA: hypothetical protein VJ819_14705 [Nocardioidaceae bacterium]|nr:hypothetical protein [Nocardioidaceae bacterium]